MCNTLNDDYFGSVFTEESDVEQLPKVEYRFSEDSNHMLQRMNLTEDAPRNRLRELKVNKAASVHDSPKLIIENAVS
jgi:hypothetical protein